MSFVPPRSILNRLRLPPSHACPAECGTLIAAKDSHPFCIACMDLKHVEEAIDFPENCSHCLAHPKMLWRRRLIVAAKYSVNFKQSDTDGGNGTGGSWEPPRAWLLQAGPTKATRLSSRGSYRVNPPSLTSPPAPATRTMWAFSRVQRSSFTPKANAPADIPRSILFEFCERVVARLNIEWPALQSAACQERDVYDRKLLGRLPARKNSSSRSSLHVPST